MHRALAVPLLLCPLLACDVAVAGLLASRSGSDSSSRRAAPDVSFKVFVRTLGGAAVDLDNEEAALILAGGEPAAPWVLAGSGTASQVFDVTALAGGPFNTVLIQAPVAQDYRIDAIELLDANGIVVETALDASIRASLLMAATPKANAEGAPDGKTADTDSSDTAKSFLFARFSTALSLFRATLAGTTLAGGDVEFALTVPRGGDQLSGGVSTTSAGLALLPFLDASSRNVILARIPTDGTSASTSSIETDTNVTGGLPSSLVDESRDRLYVSYVRAPSLTSEENLRVSRYSLATPGAATTVTELAVVGIERVEANAIALDPIGDLLVAGGGPAIAGQLSHWLRKVNVADTAVWTTPTLAVGTGNYWHGVASDGSGNVFAVGDTDGGAGDWLIQRFTSAGTASPAGPVTEGAAGADRAVAVQVDGAFVYVGGRFDRSADGEGLNGLLFKYNAADLTPAGGAFPVEINGFDDGDDEITDIAAAGGDIYVVGYSTVSTPAQGENWFVRKYDAAGTLIWERTYHHGFGDDRAVSVALNATHIVVAGEVTISGGTTDLHVRKYVR